MNVAKAVQFDLSFDYLYIMEYHSLKILVHKE
jgi:hypothetical protein